MNEYLFARLRSLIESYGIDDPHSIKCLEKASRNLEDIPLYERHFEKLLLKNGVPPNDPPPFPRLSEADKGAKGIPFGRMGWGKIRELFTLPFAAFDERHVLVTGATGTGKTRSVMIALKRLIETGIRVLIFDAASEYVHLCQFFSPEVFLVVDPRTLKINFILPPPNVDPKVWRGVLIGIFRETMFLRDGACNELNSILASLQRTRLCPSFADLFGAIQKKAYRPNSRRAGYIESLQNRAELLMNSYISDALMCCEGHPLEKVLIDRSACIRVGLVSNDLVRNFYVIYVLRWVETYLTFNPEKR